MRVLLLGGTREAVSLAGELHRRGHAVTTSLAGRTREPRPVEGALRVGGFGGAEGLARALTDGRIDLLVDATHPFARRISANAARAAERTGTRRIALHRPGWDREPADLWHEVADIEAAAAALPGGARALLALGRQHLAPFASRPDVTFVVRAIEPFDPPFPARLILARPSSDPEREADMLREHGVTHIVSRNSGGAGAHAKIAAARSLALPVVMIARPPSPPPVRVESVAEVLALVGA